MPADRRFGGIESEQALMEWALQAEEALTVARSALQGADEGRLDLRGRRTLESAAASIAAARARLAALDAGLLGDAQKTVEQALADDGPRLELAQGA